MRHRWLTFFSIAFLGLIVFIFFWYRNKPIELPKPKSSETESITEPTITFVNPSKGTKEPTVRIIEFGDFQCSACRALAATLEAVRLTYPKDIQIIWKDLPNESAHPLATPAAIAAHCADRQGMFWQYHDALFEQQTFLSETRLSQIALEIGLNTDDFAKCYDSRDTLPIVKKDYEEGLALNLTSTPTLFINGNVVVGAITEKDLLDIVTPLLSL